MLRGNMAGHSCVELDMIATTVMLRGLTDILLCRHMFLNLAFSMHICVSAVLAKVACLHREPAQPAERDTSAGPDAVEEKAEFARVATPMEVCHSPACTDTVCNMHCMHITSCCLTQSFVVSLQPFVCIQCTYDLSIKSQQA